MRRTALLAGLIAVAGCGSSYPPAGFRYAGPTAEPTLPAGERPASQAIAAAVAGNTLVASTKLGLHWVVHTKPDGLFTSYVFPAAPPASGRQWTFARGAWRSDQGRLCFRYEGERQETCYRVVAGPGVLHAYDEKENFWRFSADVKAGNPFDL